MSGQVSSLIPPPPAATPPGQPAAVPFAPGERAARWASTMVGYEAGVVRVAHADAGAGGDEVDVAAPLGGGLALLERTEREAVEAAALAPGACRAVGAGRRAVDEEPDEWRTCFERDRDRILHSSAFRRLAGKTQVFVFPDDHQRTRLTHALEVAQVATAAARALRLNVALAEAIALGHDCGHGPGGHASEDAFATFLPGGFDHATWGADVTLAPLNLCEETLDGIRNHSWSRPAPATAEGAVVSWADRIAYVCHDLEDAVAAGVVTYEMVPEVVLERCGPTRSSQLRSLIRALVQGSLAGGRIGMAPDMADALAALRSFNYEHVYLRPASVQQGAAVVKVLRALVELYADRPNVLPAFGEDTTRRGLVAGSEAALREAVSYVAGMTDRFAFSQAVTLLGFDPAALPVGVGGR